ncbi:hypothetical protein LSAT2_008223, partial [Lamellibrachia satsuma]
LSCRSDHDPMALGLAADLCVGTCREHARATRVEAGRWTRADLGQRLLDRPGRRGQFCADG